MLSAFFASVTGKMAAAGMASVIVTGGALAATDNLPFMDGEPSAQVTDVVSEPTEAPSEPEPTEEPEATDAPVEQAEPVVVTAPKPDPTQMPDPKPEPTKAPQTKSESDDKCAYGALGYQAMGCDHEHEYECSGDCGDDYHCNSSGCGEDYHCNTTDCDEPDNDCYAADSYGAMTGCEEPEEDDCIQALEYDAEPCPEPEPTEGPDGEV